MFVTPKTTTEIEAYNTSGTSKSSSTDPSAMQDRFLKMLVAQMNNQDPMNPMDNAEVTSQTAQINTVMGIQQLNETLKSMATQVTGMQTMQGASLVGKVALVEGSRPYVENSVAYGGFELSDAATDVRVDVLDAAGKVLATSTLGAQAAGRQFFEVSMEGLDTSKVATFQVTANSGTKAVTTTNISLQPITSIGMQNGTLKLTSSTGKTFGYDEVLGYR